jgi:hypothetical protein
LSDELRYRIGTIGFTNSRLDVFEHPVGF